jgi:hypothetical protein
MKIPGILISSDSKKYSLNSTIILIKFLTINPIANI